MLKLLFTFMCNSTHELHSSTELRHKGCYVLKPNRPNLTYKGFENEFIAKYFTLKIYEK